MSEFEELLCFTLRAIPFLIQGGGRNEAKNNDREEGVVPKNNDRGMEEVDRSVSIHLHCEKNDARGEEGVQKNDDRGRGCLPMLHSDPPWIKNGIALRSSLDGFCILHIRAIPLLI